MEKVIANKTYMSRMMKYTETTILESYSKYSALFLETSEISKY